MAADNFGTVDKVRITILVDNKADIIVESTEVVKYFEKKPLLAEHGFSALIQLDDSDEKILWDAGVSETALIENMQRMELDPQTISKIALSHGHFDHFIAMTALLKNMERLPKPKKWRGILSQKDIEDYYNESSIKLMAHPDAFRERWHREDNGTLEGPILPPPQQEWEAAGAKITLSAEPYQLAPGCWTTGYVPRESFEHSGIPSKMLFREGNDFLEDNMEDDQAIIFNVREKGLVVLSGCAHSGIVNTINYAREISGVEKVYAVLGGFHLAVAEDDEILETINFLKTVRPKYLVPSHCTGFKASSKIAQAMPDEFIEGVVGASYLF